MGSSSEEDLQEPQHVVNVSVGEMPEGADFSDDNEKDERPEDDPHRALDINLDEPLSPTEVLPTRQHHEVRSDSKSQETHEPIEEDLLHTSSNKKKKEKEKKKKARKVKKTLVNYWKKLKRSRKMI